MCGIAGAWWVNPPRDSNRRIDEALYQLRFRGPDDAGRLIESCGEGVVALLHKRLSIIDLSEGGHQPKTSADGRFSMVFNGEIYNYRELRQELRQLGIEFFTESDSEVLLNAWIIWVKIVFHVSSECLLLLFLIVKKSHLPVFVMLLA
jgi:asparagine synthase (glutamine-hydrolysing)